MASNYIEKLKVIYIQCVYNIDYTNSKEKFFLYIYIGGIIYIINLLLTCNNLQVNIFDITMLYH